jgi:nucleoside-diphosphate-sugar epimerase
MRNVLITGAAGFVGSQLAEACLGRGDRVTAVDALTPYYSPTAKRENAQTAQQHPACTFVEASLLELDLGELLEGVDVVFHLAAQPGVRASWGQSFDVYVDHNVTALQLLLEAAKTADLAKFVFASSSSVYGDAESLPTPEDSVLRPVSPYGATKALGEHLCYLYWKNYGLPTVSLRYFTVYGPRQRPDMAFRRLIDAALNGGELTIFGDGRQTRDFTFIGDTVTGTLAAAEHGEPGAAYNIGGGTRIGLMDVIDLITEITGHAPALSHQASQRGDARDTAADTTRARRDLGYEPTWTLGAGLGAQVEWQRAQVAVGQAL